jgi:hypothetical protein
VAFNDGPVRCNALKHGQEGRDVPLPVPEIGEQPAFGHSTLNLELRVKGSASDNNAQVLIKNQKRFAQSVDDRLREQPFDLSAVQGSIFRHDCLWSLRLQLRTIVGSGYKASLPLVLRRWPRCV